MVMIISDNFLKSAYCMYEMVKLKTCEGLTQRILPVILDGTPITTEEDRLSYKNYWQNELQQLQGLDQNKVMEIKKYIMDFFSLIQRSSFVSLAELKQTYYRGILSKIRPEDSALLEELLKIQKLEDKEDQDIALEDFIESHPQYAPAYLLRSYMEYDAKNYKKSIRYYSKAKELDSDIELWCPPPGVIGI
jgi:tetratricopeptide (TPR) repeat protein